MTVSTLSWFDTITQFTPESRLSITSGEFGFESKTHLTSWLFRSIQTAECWSDCFSPGGQDAIFTKPFILFGNLFYALEGHFKVFMLCLRPCLDDDILKWKHQLLCLGFCWHVDGVWIHEKCNFFESICVNKEKQNFSETLRLLDSFQSILFWDDVVVIEVRITHNPTSSSA